MAVPLHDIKETGNIFTYLSTQIRPVVLKSRAPIAKATILKYSRLKYLWNPPLESGTLPWSYQGIKNLLEDPHVPKR